MTRSGLQSLCDELLEAADSASAQGSSLPDAVDEAVERLRADTATAHDARTVFDWLYQTRFSEASP